MTIIDDRTANLNLPLPNQDNALRPDVQRIRDAFTAVDEAIDALQSVGPKADLVDGKVPASQLPSYVDDVLEYPAVGDFPATGEAGKIYVAINNPPTVKSKQYRWSGSSYTVIIESPGSSDEVPEGTTNKYFTDARARAAQNIATGAVLGLVKVGSGLSVSGDGTLSALGGGGGSGVPAFNELIMVPSSNGQTVFTPAGGYTVGCIELLLNGVTLYGNGDDYTSSNGTTITLTTGVNTTDALLLRRWTTATNLPFSSLVDTPTTLGGYGITDALPKAGGSLTGALNEASIGTIASASTTNIGSVDANSIIVSGNTTISSFGTSAAGVIRRLIFESVLTLTFNATSLSLPGRENITTTVGDVAEFLSLGSGNWRCISYARSSPAQDTNIVTMGAATAIDCSLGTFFMKTVSGNITFTITNPPASRAFSFTIKITHTSGTITWPASVVWPSGTAPTLTTGKVHLFMFVTDNAGTKWRGSALPNYAS